MSGAGAAFLTEAQVLDVLAKGFGITGVREVKRLGGESDQNERITTSEGQQLVFKAVRGDRGHLDAQTEVMELLKPLQCCPSSVHAVGGAALVSDDRFPGVWFRVLSYLPGEPLASFAGRGDAALLEDLGRLIGRVGGALEHYDHAALHREGFQWDLRNYEAVVKRWLSCIADVEFQASVRRVFELGHAVVAPNVDKFRCQTLHNDLNTHNILLHGKPYLIDFGDLQYTWRIADPAILIAYSMLGFTTPMAICDAVMRGYKATAPGLSEEVQKCVFPLAALRLCTSAVIAAVQSAADPENKHLTIYQVRDSFQKLFFLHISSRFAEGYCDCASARVFCFDAIHNDASIWGSQRRRRLLRCRCEGSACVGRNLYVVRRGGSVAENYLARIAKVRWSDCCRGRVRVTRWLLNLGSGEDAAICAAERPNVQLCVCVDCSVICQPQSSANGGCEMYLRRSGEAGSRAVWRDAVAT